MQQTDKQMRRLKYNQNSDEWTSSNERYGDVL